MANVYTLGSHDLVVLQDILIQNQDAINDSIDLTSYSLIESMVNDMGNGATASDVMQRISEQLELWSIQKDVFSKAVTQVGMLRD